MGIWTNLKKCKSSVLQSLIDANLASLDELSLGFKTSRSGELLTNEGNVSHGLFTLGSLRRGELWETTAVREIRQQARIIASEISAKYSYENTTKSNSITHTQTETPSLPFEVQ